MNHRMSHPLVSLICSFHRAITFYPCTVNRFTLLRHSFQQMQYYFLTQDRYNNSRPVFLAISWKDSNLSKFRGEKSAMTRPEEDSTLPLQALHTDFSEVFSSSEGPARVPSVIRTEASLALLTNSRVASLCLP